MYIYSASFCLDMRAGGLMASSTKFETILKRNFDPAIFRSASEAESCFMSECAPPILVEVSLCPSERSPSPSEE